MATYLIDTNVLLRYHDVAARGYEITTEALTALASNGGTFVVAAQNLVEFWGVATRPHDKNGLGWTPEEAESAIQSLLDDFGLLEDVPQIFRVWQQLVRHYGVSGKQVHDTRLVAAMLTFGVDALLTFNADDFRRFAEVRVIAPADVV